MRIYSSVCLCTIYLFLSAANSFALGKAVGMGDLQTVVPSGPFDTARNPALLPLQSMTNSTGLFYTYIAHIPKKESISSYGHYEDKSSSTNIDFQSDTKIDDPKINGMSVNIANSTKFNNAAIGFVFTNNGNDQYSIQERSMSSVTTTSVPGFTSESNEISKRVQLNPAFITSAGFSISKTSYIGFQALVKYAGSKEKKEYSENNSTLGPSQYQKNEKWENDVKSMSGEFGFGYLFCTDNAQIGLLIKSGDFSWIKKTLTVNTYRTLPVSQNLNTDANASINGKHTSGPNISAGGYKRINSFFALAFETRFVIQNTYQDKEFIFKDEVDNSIYEIETKNNFLTTKNSFIANGGFAFDISQSFSFGVGLGYSKVTMESDRNEYGEDYEYRLISGNNLQFYFSTAGFEYIFNPNLSISLITLLISYNGNAYGDKEEENSNMRQVFHQKVKSEGYYLHTGIGVTFSF